MSVGVCKDCLTERNLVRGGVCAPCARDRMERADPRVNAAHERLEVHRREYMTAPLDEFEELL